MSISSGWISNCEQAGRKWRLILEVEADTRRPDINILHAG